MPDYKELTKETTRILTDLIKINTVNPPGNEIEAVKYVAKLLDKEKIPYEIVESEPGRASIIARLKGSGSKKPVMMMAHLDVVGVEPEKWKFDPFSATLKDDYIYGRGAIDDKGMAACELLVMLEMKRKNVPLKGDLILTLCADEEAGGSKGIEFLVNKHLDKIKAEFVINEGGRIIVNEHTKKVGFVGIQNTEKVPVNIKLVAKGTPGHASVPLPDNCIFKLSKAQARLADWQPPVKLNETTRAFFKGLSRSTAFPESFYMENLEHPELGAFCAAQLTKKEPILGSTMRNSISPTILKSGIRSNVIPSEAEVNLNVRLLPEERLEGFIQQLKEVINDNGIEIVYNKPEHPDSPASPVESELFRAMAKVGKELWPEAVTVPFMSTGATDAAYLRAKGIPTYGILPFPLNEDDLARMHGHNERLSLNDLEEGLKFMHLTVVELNK
jgi:acetylornithine deacetylase/succinyl-diaminopimelate desuccinylase-like protein